MIGRQSPSAVTWKLTHEKPVKLRSAPWPWKTMGRPNSPPPELLENRVRSTHVTVNPTFVPAHWHSMAMRLRATQAKELLRQNTQLFLLTDPASRQQTLKSPLLAATLADVVGLQQVCTGLRYAVC